MKRPSVIAKLIKTGVEREYTKEEMDAMAEELFKAEFREHERLRAAGLLDSFKVEREEGAPPAASTEVAQDRPLMGSGLKLIIKVMGSND